MLICKNCGGFFPENQVDSSGLCEKCRQAAEDASAAGGAVDWKKPLYDYALTQEKRWRASGFENVEAFFIRLGDYSDCPDRLQKLRAERQKFYDDNVKTIREGSSISMLRQAVDNLRAVVDFSDAAAMIEKGEKRIKALDEEARLAAAEQERLARLRKRRTNIILASIAAVLVIAFIGYGLIVPPMRLETGDALLAEGNFADAIAAYEKAHFIANVAEIDAKIHDAHMLWADRMIAENDYEGAIAKYLTLKEEHLASPVVTVSSDAFTEEMDAAAGLAYRKWSDYLAENGDAKEAIAKLWYSAPSDDFDQRLAELRTMQTDQAIAAVKEFEVPDPFAARLKGEELNTLNEQLRYCRALFDEGYDLMEVYPEGVSVVDAPLGAYQIDELPDIEDAYLDLDTSKFLLFERTERPYEEEQTSKPLMDPHDRHDDSIYSVKLLPGQMFGQYEQFVAESWEDASAIVLVDSIHLEYGAITSVTEHTMNGVTVSTSSKDYPYYAAVSSLAIYDKENPASGSIFDSVINEPICDDDAWFNQNKRNSLELFKIENRTGTFDTSSAYEYLDVCLMLLTIMY